MTSHSGTADIVTVRRWDLTGAQVEKMDVRKVRVERTVRRI
jgi:hypothetical protein